MPDTAMRLAALAAAMTDAELAQIILEIGENRDTTPEQRAAIDETALRLTARQIDEGRNGHTTDVPSQH